MPFAENNAYISKQLSVLKEEKEYAEYIDRIFELSEMVLAGKQKILSEHFEKHMDFGLSERELEIAKLAAQRMTSAEIADKLHISCLLYTSNSVPWCNLQEDERKSTDTIFGILLGTFDATGMETVSYTHLDVYKRQRVIKTGSNGIHRSRIAALIF